MGAAQIGSMQIQDSRTLGVGRLKGFDSDPAPSAFQLICNCTHAEQCHREDAGAGRAAAEVRIEAMIQELFSLQDLNSDGVLEEAELVKLNEKIAMVHYGKDIDRPGLRRKYRKLFRERLSPSGEPVPYKTFRRYMREVLGALDNDLAAHEMILEQFIIEAKSARALFHCESFASVSDATFLPIPFAEGVVVAGC
mmetsp:Transcript_2796/g.7515  ORF Transcript_2796/g.7515 Transcript_2796/m.7515 type:complete len:195 (-) Transcript_2796:133-717(-)